MSEDLLIPDVMSEPSTLEELESLGNEDVLSGPEEEQDLSQEPAEETQPIQSSPAERHDMKDRPSKITLRVFLSVCGHRPDQTAGFQRWMKPSKVRRRTLEEWWQEWNAFMTRPVGGSK